VRPRVRAFAGVRGLFTSIKETGGAIAVATDCKGSPLKVYRSLLDVDDLIDHIACGDELKRESPTRSCVWRSKSWHFPRADA
jgi:hypothetical protein